MKRPNEYPEGLKDQRVVKLLLPLPLIRQIDRVLLDGVGGFTTRNEFVREAIESYVLALTHEPAPVEPAQLRDRRRRLRSVAAMPAEEMRSDALVEGALAIGDTALTAVAGEAVTIGGEAQVIAEPLFGMHNRDYPSLWAARQLVAYLDEG